MTPYENKRPGLYVHIPFCRSRCGYCTFIRGDYDTILADHYINAIHAEYNARQICTPSNPPSTLFIGGGTPSMLSVAQLDALLAGLPNATEEATCESNPDSISPEKLRILADHGITRLSIGVQTFSPHGLQLLGRAHTAGDAIRAVEMARKEGFENISIDLIYCWPGQELEDLKKDITISLSLGVQHISYYTIIIEPFCRDYAMLFDLMSRYEDPDEREKRYWDIIEQQFENNGFTHYETSNYALSGKMCRYNVDIWRGGEYLGLGIAAHSHIAGRRYANTGDVEVYCTSCSNPERIEAMSERLTGVEKARECVVFWLRLFEGIDTGVFTKKTGYTLEELYGDILTELIERKMLEWDDSGRYIRVPKEKQAVLDSILVELI